MTDDTKKLTVDARGLSCPQPVLDTKRALESAAAEVDVLVDTVTSRENVIRFARKSGWTAEPSPEDDYFRVNIRKKV